MRAISNLGILRRMATIADLEQWIADTELALTVERGRVAALTPDLPAEFVESPTVQDLLCRLGLLHLQRRRMLSGNRHLSRPDVRSHHLAKDSSR